MTKPFTLHLGDCLEVMRAMPSDSVDSIVCDPPYGLAFMGKRWDYDVPSVEIWAECLRVLKPGGHLLAFAGTRTQHRMAVRIEDAGFEIRDMIAWVYGSGFPKSMDVGKAIDKAAGAERTQRLGPKAGHAEFVGRDNMSALRDGPLAGAGGFARPWMHDPEKVEAAHWRMAPATEEARQWDGWGTALKPAMEPITVARKPLVGTVAANVLAHGTGALNIDGCRVPTEDDLNGGAYSESGGRTVSPSLHAGSGMNQPGKTTGREYEQPSGRWPANLIHDGSDEVVAHFPAEAGQAAALKTRNSDMTRNAFGAFAGTPDAHFEPHDAGGSAARFFYCPKTTRKDRNEGLADPGPRLSRGSTLRDAENLDDLGNHHPTVKPTALMAYLLRLVTPPGGVALDPFMGSGSTGKAAMREGFRFIGCELSEEYLAIAEARIEHEWRKQLPAESLAAPQLDLFAESVA